MDRTTERLTTDDGKASGDVGVLEKAHAVAASHRRYRRSTIAAGVVSLGGLILWLAPLGGGQPEPATDALIGLDTAEVMRGDLVHTVSLAGDLGYGRIRGLAARAQGTVTALPQEGDAVTRGGTLYEIDAKPVTLLYGSVPVFRELSVGSQGQDVRQLERNLRAFGYEGLTVDDTYTTATSAAVRQWQADAGLEVMGRVDPARIVFARGPLRVAGHTVNVGAQVVPGTEVITVSSTEQVVTMDIEIADIALVTEGAPVTIELPDGTTVKGDVHEVGKVATGADDASGQGGSNTTGPSTIEVIVSIREGEDTAGFDQAPVDVRFESSRTEDVLSVPVAALIAVEGGRYAVEVIDEDQRTAVPVEVGTFVDGRVEVSGTGIAEGTLVGVPRS